MIEYIDLFLSTPFAAILIIKTLTAFIIYKASVIVVREGEAVIIERFGGFLKVLSPGIHFIVPFIDSPKSILWQFTVENSHGDVKRKIEYIRSISTRETLYDFPAQKVITKDNISIEIDALLYYQINDVKAAVYGVSNLPNTIEKLAQTALRNVIGSLELDETLASREHVNRAICTAVNESIGRWGALVTTVEVQEITPPKNVCDAMELQMKAERTKRALIVEAEGKRNAAILQAQGEKDAAILKGEGEKMTLIARAQGEAESKLISMNAEIEYIDALKRTLPSGDPTSYLVAMNYLKMLPEVTKGKNDKVIMMPYESSALMGSVATMSELFHDKKK
mmetsp:Transcript_17783/g.26266  ORF Transcript_17783/g.26266 Transcript_17783/m.26266 type:complete len:337 (+) Transcript_17783:42-1052(+)